uniref:Perilipin 1 n=1 Tax=Equus caballus TaxID=9796 RepID=A0A9L0TL63_HORSE
MAVNKDPALLEGDLPEQENVLQRVLQLPVVSGTCACFQKTYTSTKEAHPLVASVCNAYEKGVQGAGSLAAWSMEPVVRRLSTQFTAANELACRGLDHLEEKIPALQYPPEKIASELKDTISTRLRSARNSISVPIASTSDKVLEAALAGCELAWGVAKDTAEYAANTRAGRLASGGADLALGGIEKVVEFLLPPAEKESEQSGAVGRVRGHAGGVPAAERGAGVPAAQPHGLPGEGPRGPGRHSGGRDGGGGGIRGRGEQPWRGSSPAQSARPPGQCGARPAEGPPGHHLGRDLGPCSRAGHRREGAVPRTSPPCLLHQGEGHVAVRRPEGCY